MRVWQESVKFDHAIAKTIPTCQNTGVPRLVSCSNVNSKQQGMLKSVNAQTHICDGHVCHCTVIVFIAIITMMVVVVVASKPIPRLNK